VRAPEDLHSTIEETIVLALVGGPPCDLELQLQAESAVVSIDKVQIQQVLFNLVRNGREPRQASCRGRPHSRRKPERNKVRALAR
jgi:nitrogen fixation/metabolism regulation signal transduction histidine kinase